ncbi:cysteine synthase family protein [bacterium]|nr:cysteine synthase family protein [bacterium]
MIRNNILECVGDTPIVRLNKIGQNFEHELLVKVEFFNPGSSIKDRIAKQMVDDAVAEGKLKEGGTIIECTSGNTGMGLAMVACVKGFKCICVMPDKVSNEKIKILEAMGCQVVVTPTAVEPDDPRSYYSVAKKLAEETENSFYVDQYHNPSNPKTHLLSTGPEIYQQLGGELDYLVVASGTGGTLCGTAKYLKEKIPHLKAICIDPIGSIYYDYFKTGEIPKVVTSYKVEGFGEDFMPDTIDFDLIDDVIQVSDKECFDMTRELAAKEGIFAGGSCGGAIAGGLKVAEKTEGKKRFLMILPDSGSRYISKVYDNTWLKENGYI